MTIKQGDKVKYLSEIGGGTVTKIINKNEVYILNDEGFEVPAYIKELIIVENNKISESYIDEINKNNIEDNEKTIKNDMTNIYEEETTIQNDELKIYMALVPFNNEETKSLNIYLINDSIHNLLYSYILKEKSETSVNSAGLLEPNTKLFLENINFKRFNHINNFIFQIIIFKKGLYKLKKPFEKEITIKPMEIFNEYSYVENDFFNENALIIPIIKEDALTEHITRLTNEDIDKIIVEKEKITSNKSEEIISKKHEKNNIKEIDLHINKLLDNVIGLSNSGILDIQMKHFKNNLEEAIKNKIKKIVFIHGIGNGTLKMKIRNTLDSNYKYLKYQDASFQKYRFGATLVIIS
ncbi:MAG: DUF2027 domain-containing protein [Bacteroidales bacterium]|nr:DUF2027 domain-containing protein [Bacteroidales bacterium]